MGYEQNNENILEFLTRKRKADGIYFRSMKYLGTRWTCFVFEGCCYTQPNEAYEQLETRIAKRAQYIAKHAAENKTGGQPPTTPKIKSKSARNYGTSNKSKLKGIAKKYDPQQVFQQLQPGYFKLDRAPIPNSGYFSL
ncbi:FAD binding domain protein [Fusarium oxysporum f. sp. phaseoli]